MTLSNIKPLDIADFSIATGNNGKLPDDSPEHKHSVSNPDFTQQAVWVAGQLRASLEPNVALERSQEVLGLIYSRYKQLSKHMKLLIPPDVEQDF